MMKLNKVNIIYLVIAGILLVATAFQVFKYRSWDRYYYDATVIAPESYPIHIRDCYLITADEDDLISARKEEVNDQNSNWNSDGDFLEIRDKMLLPEKISISYFSYREDKFYKGVVDLPKKRIEEIFKQAIANKSTEKYYSYRGQNRGLTFTVGVANNGEVLVWMRGIYLEQLILRTRLKPSEPDPDDMYYEENLSKEAYLKHAFEHLSDSVKLLYKNGYDSPANYGDSATKYIEGNKDLWEYQIKNGMIDFKK